jgi:phosphatidylserine/phosphatidylglycerophosphate/cardiolipin synthase-like enzyme
MFTFTLQQLADALIDAKNRGVDVRVVLERSQEANEGVCSRLVAAGVEVRMDNNEALMHNKIAIVDSGVVLTGSFNWTESGNNSNNENLVVISDPILARSYEAQFQAIWNESSGLI